MPTPEEEAFQALYGSPKPEQDPEEAAFQSVYGKPGGHTDIAARQTRRVVKAMPGAEKRGRMIQELAKPASTPAAQRGNLETLKRVAAEPQALTNRVENLMDMSAVRTGQVSPDALGALSDLAAKQRPDEPKEPSLLRDLGTRAGEGIFGKLDVPAEALRQALTPGHEIGTGPLDPAKSLELYQQAADKGDAKSYLYKPYVALNRAGGDALGQIFNLPVEGYDLVKRALGRPTDPALMEEMRAGTRKAGQELLHGLLLDPLNALSFGGAGTGKAAAQAAARSLAKAGAADDVAKALSKEIAGAVATHGSSPAGVQAVDNLIAKAGLTEDAARSVRADIIGKRGELLEAGGLRVSAPLLPDLGFDVAAAIPKALRVERAGAKTIRAGGEALDALPGAIKGKSLPATAARRTAEVAASAYDKVFPWLKPAKEQARSAAAMGRALERYLGERGTESLAGVMRDAPVDEARRGQILKEFIDPAHSVPVKVGSDEYIELSGQGLKETRFKRAAKGEKELTDYAVFGRQLDDLTEQELKWVEGLTGFFDAYHTKLVKAGLLEAGQYGRNLLTGRYVPRILESMDDAAELAQGLRQGPGYSPVKGRDAASGGTPIGGYEQLLSDPAKIGTQYMQAANKLMAKRAAMDALAKAYPEGIPEVSRAIVDASFDKSAASMSQLLRKKMPFTSSVLREYEKALNVFKKNVLVKTPGYHWMNFAEDISKMAADGVNNPDVFRQARQVLNGAGFIKVNGEKVRMSDFLAEAQSQGFGWGVNTRADLFDTSPLARIDEAVKSGARARGEKVGLKGQAMTAARKAGKTADAVTLGPAGLKIAQTWDDLSKVALYLHHRNKGMSPTRAAARVREVLLDYGDLTNPVIGAARTFMPFAQWVLKMPLGAAKMTARQPGRVSAIGRAQEAVGGKDVQDDVYAAPGYERERGKARVMGPGGQAFSEMLMRDATGSGLGANERAYVNFRDPWSETSSLVGRALRSPRSFGETVIGQLDPLFMGAGETLLDRDVRNLRPLGQALDQRTVDAVRSSPLNPGRLLDAMAQDPADPDESARAVAQAAAHAQRNLPTFIPHLGSPLALQLINQQLHDPSDPGSPLNTVGMFRPPQDIPPEQVRALQWARLLTRWGVGVTGPDELWRDYLRNPERQQLEEVINPQVRQIERAYPYPSK